MNLSIAMKIFESFEYFSKYCSYGGLIEYSMFTIGGPGFMFDNIQ